jgi:two-component system, LytTR family, sensor kinase
MNIKPNRYYWIAQIIGWFSYCGLVVLSVYTNNPKQLTVGFFVNIFILIVSGILTTHIQRLFFLKAGWLDMKLPALIPRLIVASFLASLIIAGVDFSVDYYVNWNGKQNEEIKISSIVVSVFAVLILVLFWNAIYFTYHFFQKSRKQEISNLELAASNKENELRNLRSQLNPHFLFNSLNSIRALIDLEPSKAKVAITSLSNLLRESLLLGRENLVPLSSELSIAKNYLELEKIRFEERLEIEWDLNEQLDHFLIPPFSLQMMIENAIKHGIAQLRDGGRVKITTRSMPKAVLIEVRNSGNLRTVQDLGVGIHNVRKRLQLQFGEGASFELKEENNEVIALLIFTHEDN